MSAAAAVPSAATQSPGRVGRFAAAVAVVALLVLALVSARVVERGRFALAYSTYGAGPDGALALHELLRREGHDVRRWAEDLGRLPPGGMLVLLGGCDALSARPLSRAERERLVRWVEDGGVLVVAGAGGIVDEAMGTELRARAPDGCEHEPGLVAWARALDDEPVPPLPPPSDVPPAGAPRDGGAPFKPPGWVPSDAALAEMLAEFDEAPEDDVAWATPIAEPLTGMPFVSMRRTGTIDVRAWDRTRVLLVAQGKNVGVVSALGAGVVVTLASASMFQNRDLAEGGGAALFLRLVSRYAPAGPVVFDEYHVGAGERRSMIRYFTQLGVAPLLLQALFALGLVLVARGRPFGGRREAVREPVSATSAFVHALAGLFQKSGDTAGALELVKKDALLRVARFHHATERDPDALARVLEERGRGEAAAAVRAVRDVAAPARREGVAASVASIDAALARALRRD